MTKKRIIQSLIYIIISVVFELLWLLNISDFNINILWKVISYIGCLVILVITIMAGIVACIDFVEVCKEKTQLHYN